MIFDGKVILRGFKDPSINLWTVPIGKYVHATQGPNILSQPGPCLGHAPHFRDSSALLPPPVALATCMHSVQTRSNAVKFAHQSLCSPKISTLPKAVHRRFLRGCPNMTEPLILKYLNPSAATAKGHMKRPCHDICSTCTRTLVKDHDTQVQVAPVPVILPFNNAPPVYHVPVILPFANDPPVYQPLPLDSNIIADNDDQSIANIFCFGAFADKQSGIVYHDLM